MFLTKRDNPYRDLIDREATVVRNTGVGDMFGAGYGESAYLTSQRADGAVYAKLYKQNMEVASKLAGEDMTDYTWDLVSFRSLMMDYDGVAHDNNDNPIYGKLKEQVAKLDELKKLYPQIKTAQELRDDSKVMARQMEGDAREMWQRSGPMASVAGFAGNVAGSFTDADPVNQLTLGLGGFGKTIAMRIATEAGISSAIETINQFTGVDDARRRLGLEALSTPDKIKQIAFAGAGAGLFRGGFEVTGKGYRSLEAKLAPENELDRILAADLAKPDAWRRVGEYLDKNVKSPRDREAITHALDTDAILIRNNPFDKGIEGQDYFSDQVNDFITTFETGKTRADLMASSGIARTNTFFGNMDKDAALDITTSVWEPEARARNPAVFKQLDEQRQAVTELEKRIQDMENAASRRTVEDTVEAFDPVIGQRLKAINIELDGTPNKKRRAALEKERDMLSDSLNEKVLARVESDVLIGQRKSVKSMRSSLESARRKLRDVKKEAYQEIDKVVRDNKNLTNKKNKAPVGTKMSRTDQSVGVDDIPAAGKNIYNEAKLTIDDKTNTVKIGSRTLNLDDDIPMEAVIGDGQVSIRTMKVRDVLKEIEEDEKMVKAMEVCLL